MANTKDKLYNEFMQLIGKYNNDDLLKLANSIIEYVNNDKESE